MSKRQAECVRLAKLGKTGIQIADELGISPKTVSVHLHNARKAGVRMRAMSHRMISLPVDLRLKLDRRARKLEIDAGELARKIIGAYFECA